MTTTAAQWIAETESHVLSGIREVRNRLSTALTDTTTTSVVMANPVLSAGEGSMICIDLEEMYVETNDGNRTATVIRGDGGSTAATHSANAIITVNPRASKFRILRAINNSLLSLSSPRNGLFKIASVDLTYSAAARGYDLTAVTSMFGDPLKVLAKTSGTEKDWPEIHRWRFSPNMPTSSFASGKAIFLDQPGEAGQTIRVFYMSPFTALSALTDDVSTTGVPATAYDIPPLAAAVTLLASRPNQRADVGSQGNSKDSQEVSTTDTLNASSGLRLILRDRINEEAARLASDWPARLRR